MLERWLTPLVAIARSLDLGSPPRPGALLELVEESVRVQVRNVANSGPVSAAWAQAEPERKLWVHGLVYELETGRLRDLNVTRGRP